ncbi:hypothetical protein HXA34_06910 [Salipaludibacillus agaradhaerens]|uniref:hypothetical protein n=1 Tax=Salipaludibacillus agaradhaerens TaxID=76935 RepID=UPI002151740C|nr:hypothetical protein [Salipaludibacillus agaradhaerens]MCR6106007.1 hypothetical protein [Salipaludibacillus agaradhaerens]MCR6110083.1 hypothetical protein [Bacillus sp. A301a_S52]MCR6118040.1 hypothetical protein [Salipaludibacillus agaradhaerens]UJW57177.1 hypothetical protein HXZ66_07060 [Bacillus sp. A116_S68]
MRKAMLFLVLIGTFLLVSCVTGESKDNNIEDDPEKTQFQKNKESDEEDEYWTEEKMKEAEPHTPIDDD